ncbi:vacuolar membrane protein-domain-containing protein [Gilbertella persicaria]|uniref:vacuolar membrane protein-domain-containing protein n=1 Tax=Gilbertella persicaria TaxID=101096 RepID=UPI002220BEA2|nr:vacuolar membrane protein-domain-containing protein [Gilbertella persicaria]KAI8079578.1 vacuolar membrane protein-domain-containing protein [Gilbertella persicaria]
MFPRSPQDELPEGGCQLMDGFGIFIQLCLATTAFSTLIYKRQREEPRRPIRIWAMDVSKQLAGGVMIHTLNVIAAVFFGVHPEEGVKSNPCVWYFLNILVDTTVGIGILWLILTGFKYLVGYLGLSGFQSGVYGPPPLTGQLVQWAKQLLVYVVSLFLMKMIVIAIFHLCPWLSDFGQWVLEWTVGNYKLQVAFVMLIFPLVMNIMQFWVIDTFIKHKSEHTSPIIRLDRDEEDAEALLHHEENETDPPPRYSIESDRRSNVFIEASSSSDLPTSRENEYEMKSKK